MENNNVIKGCHAYGTILSLIHTVEPILKNFPKDIKPTYGDDFRHTLISAMSSICRAFKSTNPAKKAAFLEDVSADIDILKILTRISVDFKYITPENMASIDLQLVELGKEIGGWLKSLEY